MARPSTGPWGVDPPRGGEFELLQTFTSPTVDGQRLFYAPDTDWVTSRPMRIITARRPD